MTRPGQLGRVLLLAAIALLVARPAGAQTDGQAVDAYVREVLQRHPGLQAQALRRDGLRAEARAEGRWPDPTLSLMADDWPERMGGEMPMTQVRLDQMLPWPGKLDAMRAMVARRADGAGAELDTRRLDARRDARQAFWSLVRIDEKRAINGAARALLDAVVQATRARYGAGAGSHRDVVRAQVERNALEVAAVALDGERTAAVARLNALRDRPVAAPVALTPTEETPLAELDTARLAERAVALRPELGAMRAMRASMAAMADLARRERFPDLMLGAWWNRMKDGTDTYGGMVGAPLPLVGVSRQGLRARAAGLQAEALTAEIAAMRAMIRFEVTDAVRRVDTAARTLEFLRRVALPKARESFDVTLGGYAAGNTELTAVLEARRAVQIVEEGLADAVSERESALAALERAVGGPLGGQR